MNIAIQNIHLLPNLGDIGIHNYILDLVSSGKVRYLYFEEDTLKKNILLSRNLKLNKILKEITKNNNVEYIYTSKKLNSTCDLLLNFNTHTKDHDFTDNIKKFEGLKIWHVGDYFWNEPGSIINERYQKYGVDYLFGYSSHDKYCEYFQTVFPSYIGKVIPVPFGFQKRFKKTREFSDRLNKCVALGSVNPLRPLQYNIQNYIESSNFYPDEAWFHKFRRMILLKQSQLRSSTDIILPVFPKIKDFDYDLVEKFNEYQMFVSCESIFHFPPAKFFEGPACGTALVCAKTGCNLQYGFKDGINCIMYKEYDVADYKEKVEYYQHHPEKLIEIQKNGYNYVRKHFSHEKIAENIIRDISGLK